MLTHLALVLLASVTLVYLGQWLCSRIDRRLSWIILATIGICALIEHASFPLPLASVPDPKPVYVWLGIQRDLHALIELPVGSTPRGAELENVLLHVSFTRYITGNHSLLDTVVLFHLVRLI
jgi:hypothetical protein